MKHKLIYLDICLPDYFLGYSKPVLSIPVWKDMTKEELTKAIISEYNNSYEYIVSDPLIDYDGWPDLSDEELEKMYDEFIKKDTPFIDMDIPSSEEYDEHYDNVMLYITCI